jgi:pyruvate/2-oxoglutarate dehydrogenase complex dihydrolipoamide acyltransferase (E2) component
MSRRMAAASAAVCREANTIHLITEADVSIPRRLIREHAEQTGERLSLTAYVVSCLARAVTEHPEFNSLISRGRLVALDDITIGVLVERTVAGEQVPESLPVSSTDSKSVGELTAELRGAQQADDERLGGLTGATWVRFVPSFLFRAMIRLASRNVRVTQRYGAISVTSVGMFATGSTWLVPLSASTVNVAVGGIVERPVVREDGAVEGVEYLCITASFDHDIIDGAPAARFTSRFVELVSSGEVLGSRQRGRLHDECAPARE